MKKINNILFICISISCLLFVKSAPANLIDDFDVTVRPEFTQPQFSNEDPINGSIITVTSYNWTINITDSVPFNWTINCSNAQSSSGNLSVNGTFYLNLTNLSASTYTIYVNATNGNLTSNEWYIFTYVPSATIGEPPGESSADDNVLPKPSDGVIISTLMISGIFLFTTMLATICVLLFYRKRKQKGK